MKEKSYILTIAGLDPSNGAGLIADIKTFQAHSLYGLSVCTAVTIQNDVAFKECLWIEEEIIIGQIDILFERFSIDVVKIGIIKSWSLLLIVVKRLRKKNPTIKIILDPVLKASAGFNFHEKQNMAVLEEVLNECYFITPNYDEIQALFPNKTIEETIDFIAQRTNTYLKGGHRVKDKGCDEVYYSKLVKFKILPIAEKVSEKHGSGCVLSSALASNFQKGMSIEDACKNAKAYTERFLNSNETLLGTHNM